MPNSAMPIRKNAMPNSVNSPSPRADDQAPDGEEDDEDHGQQRDEDPREREHLQRHQRECRHEIEIEADQLVERVLGFAGRALFVPHFDLGGPDANV